MRRMVLKRVGRTWALAPVAMVVLSAGLAQAQGESRMTREQEQAVAHAEALSSAFRHVAATVRPSVVQVRSAEVVRQQVFNPFQDPFGMRPREQEFRREGLGSGVIISGEGYILTNNHVVEGADELVVVFADETEVTATIVGTDPQTDLAVIRVERDEAESRLVPARIGDSERVEVGDWVVAVGSPLGLSETVTAGIISATGRRQGIIDRGRGYESFLQTDAAINRGNSGGPLVNLRGEVIGINTAIASTSGGSIGLGFAIPSSLFKDVADQIIETGSVRRGLIGVQLSQVGQRDAELLGLDPNVRGAVVDVVEPESPAARAGVQPRDVITSVNGKAVRDVDDVRLAIAAVRPGGEVTLDVLRDGERVTIKATTTDASGLASATSEVGEATLSGLGLSVGPVTEQTARRLGMRQPMGVEVTEVRPRSEAEDAGFEPGDIILQLFNLRVTDAAGLGEMIARARPGTALRFTVVSAQGQSAAKVLRLPPRGGR